MKKIEVPLDASAKAVLALPQGANRHPELAGLIPNRSDSIVCPECTGSGVPLGAKDLPDGVCQASDDAWAARAKVQRLTVGFDDRNGSGVAITAEGASRTPGGSDAHPAPESRQPG